MAGQLTKKERDVIKERYSAFNDAFDQVVALQQELTIPDVVRTPLALPRACDRGACADLRWLARLRR